MSTHLHYLPELTCCTIHLTATQTSSSGQEGQTTSPLRHVTSGVSFTINGVNSPSSTAVQIQRRNYNSQVRVTKMLVLVSSTFLILNLPSHALRLYAFTQSMIADDSTNFPQFPERKFVLVQRLFQYLYYTNFAINFLIYNMCGQNFRHALQRLARKMRYHIRYKCLPRKYNGKEFINMVHVKTKDPLSGEDSNDRTSSEQRMNANQLRRVQPKKRSGGQTALNTRGTSFIQGRSHQSHSSCHSFYSCESQEQCHQSPKQEVSYQSYYSFHTGRSSPSPSENSLSEFMADHSCNLL